MRILLTGAGGQLGTDVVRAAANRPDHDLTALRRDQLDVTDRLGVNELFQAADPDVVIHAAAHTAVDLCESDEDGATAINDVGTRHVAESAARVGARVIYVSTDYVFDGSKAEPYVETDEPNPASVYGRTKLAGEGHIGSDGLIVRTSWVCGANGSNMVKTILRAAENHPTLTFVDDQIGKPTFTADLADVLLDLAGRSDTGIMHVTNERAVSWYGFCREVLASAGLDPDRVAPCTTEELQPPRPAPRPANSVLANTRFEALGLPLLRDFRPALDETVTQLQG
jgi:dTDP-4-dehydrorhamnose reductase